MWSRVNHSVAIERESIRAKNDKENGEYGKTHELDGLASPGVDEEEGEVVARDQTANGKDQVTDADILQVVVDELSTVSERSAETDCLENNGRIESQSVEGNL